MPCDVGQYSPANAGPDQCTNVARTEAAAGVRETDSTARKPAAVSQLVKFDPTGDIEQVSPDTQTSKG